MNRPYSARDHLPGELYSAEQVRVLDRLAIEQAGISAFELMSRAGEAAFACLLGRWPEEQQICVFAGPGNNGGDAWVLAALARLHGMDVRFYTVGDHGRASDSAQQARQMALEAGVQPEAYSGELDYEGHLIVDGLLGTGLNAPVKGEFAHAIAAINQHWADVLALDLPSGLNADTGTIMGDAVRASMTVTFIGVKQGLLTAAGPDVCGEVAFASLAVEPSIYRRLPATVERISWDRCDRLGRRLPARAGSAHKGDFGHVLVIGGDTGMGGAVAMAAEAAGRCGSGLVSCATRTEHVVPLLVRRPEIMVRGIESGLELQPLLEKASVLAIGPGLGQGSWSELLLQQVLGSRLPLLMDADALNILASPGWKQDFAGREVILTPHPGEAARLLGVTSADVQADRFRAARQLAERYQAVVVLKGQGTLIASPEGRLALCTDGNPGMSSGGMGDVLSGVIAALLAQGMTACEAACIGVCIHSAAADMAARGGQRGLLASDLMMYLRELMN